MGDRILAAALEGTPAATLRLPARDAPGRWAHGVALAATGRYGTSERLLRTVDDPPLWHALALSTRASIYRQVGAHGTAGDLDAAALAVARHLPRSQRWGAAAAYDAVLGLAADAVGVGDLAAARSRLAAARALLPVPARAPAVRTTSDWGTNPWQRQAVRFHWVACEVALLGGDAAGAARAARRSLVVGGGRSPRHTAKSLLFLGASEAERDPAAAVRALDRAVRIAGSLGARPLLWPACLVLARVAPDGEAVRARGAAAYAQIGADLPAAPWPASSPQAGGDGRVLADLWWRSGVAAELGVAGPPVDQPRSGSPRIAAASPST